MVVRKIFVATLVVAAVGCKSTASDSGVKDDDQPTAGNGTATTTTMVPGVERLQAAQGDLGAVEWFKGADPCTSGPLIQVYQYGPNTYVLREGKCVTFEGPFNFLLFGKDKAFLLDTGDMPNVDGGPSGPDGERHPDAKAVNAVIQEWLAANNQTAIDLVVAHTHSHGDHIGGDSQFQPGPHLARVGYGPSKVMNFFGFSNWPSQIVDYDLGGRDLKVTGIPGHLNDHIAIFDPETKWLFTGDSLYPGRLYVQNWTDFRASMQRLYTQAQDWNPVNCIGNHIEMSTTPGHDFVFDNTYQPDEHKLPMTMDHLKQLAGKLKDLGPSPKNYRFADFIICPNANSCNDNYPNDLNPLDP